MTNITQLLQQLGAQPSYFAASSRYNGIATATLNPGDPEPIVYLKRRFVPGPDGFFQLYEHTVIQGERLDNVAYQYLGDPQKFWQICDANNVLEPDELTSRAGNKIKITLPQGIPGNNA